METISSARIKGVQIAHKYGALATAAVIRKGCYRAILEAGLREIGHANLAAALIECGDSIALRHALDRIRGLTAIERMRMVQLIEPSWARDTIDHVTHLTLDERKMLEAKASKPRQ